MTELGERLKTLRKRAGLTQKELADRVIGGINYTYIGNIERGEQTPSIKILKKLSQALSIPIDYFFREDTPVDTLGILPDEVRDIAQDKDKRLFLQCIRVLKKEDIPLIIEIINLLNKHHKLHGTDVRITPVPARKQRFVIKPQDKIAAETRSGYGSIIAKIEKALASKGSRLSMDEKWVRDSLTLALEVLRSS